MPVIYQDTDYDYSIFGSKSSRHQNAAINFSAN